MKLHLPLTLRSALLTVLASFSLAYAGETITVGGKNNDREYTLEGRFYEDLTIIVSEGGELRMNSNSTKLTGNSKITVNKDGAFRMTDGFIARADSIYSRTHAVITVENEASFTMAGGSIARAIVDNSTASAEIVMKDNARFTMSGEGTSIARAWTGKGTASVEMTLNNQASFIMSSGKIAFAYATDSTARAKMTLNNNASFTMTKGYLAEASGANSTASAEITLNGASSFINSANYTYIAYAFGSNSTASVKITLNDNSTYTNNYGSTYIANAYSGTARAEITLNDKSTFTTSGLIAYTGGTDNQAYAEITLNDEATFTTSGSIAYAFSKGTASAEITVNDKATFTSGRIAYASGGTAGAEITVNDKATFTSNGSIASSSGGTASAEITVNDEATFSGGLIAYASGGTASAEITVNDKATFTSNGNVAYALSSNSTASVKITLNGEATFIKDGRYTNIANTNESNSTASVEITLNDNSTFTMLEGKMAFTVRGSNSHASAEITLNDHASFIMSGWYIAEGSGLTNTASAVITLNGASTFTMHSVEEHLSSALSSGSASVELTLNDEASFDISHGYIAAAIGSNSDASVEISLNDRACFTMSGEYIAFAGNAGVSTETNIIGSTAHATITVSDNATFTMAGGIIAFLKSNTTDSSSTATITIAGQGTFSYTRGKDKEVGAFGDGAEFFVEDQGVINMNGLSMAAVIDDATFNAPKITMRGGSLKNAAAYSGELVIDVEKGFSGGSIDLGGVDAARISRINVAQSGVQLIGLKQGSTLTFTDAECSLAVSTANTSLSSSAAQSLIMFDNGRGKVAFREEGSVSLLIDLQSDVLMGLKDSANSFTVNLTNGTIEDVPSNREFAEWAKKHFTFRNVLQYLGFSVNEVKGGNVTISGGRTDNAFFAVRDGKKGGRGRTATSDSMKSREAVVVDDNLDITVSGNSARLKHVDSLGADKDLDIRGKQSGNIEVEFHNEEHINTELGGDLTLANDGTGSATMNKTGEGTFTVGGNLEVDGDLSVSEGGLTLNGEGSNVGGDLRIGDERGGTKGNLEVNGRLTVEGDLDLRRGDGSISGDGELLVEGNVTLGENVDMNGPILGLVGKNSSLNMNGQDATLSGLSGNGSVRGMGNLTFSGGESDFRGSMKEGSGNILVTGAATHQSFTDVRDGNRFNLTVEKKGALTLSNSTFGNAEAHKNSTLEFRAGGTGRLDKGGANVTINGSLILRNGSTTILTFNLNTNETWSKNSILMVSAGAIYLEREACFELNALQSNISGVRDGDLTNVMVMRAGEIHVGNTFAGEGINTLATGSPNEEVLQNVSLRGLFNVYYESASLTVRGNAVYMNAVKRANGFFEEVGKENGDENAEAGGKLLDGVDMTKDDTLAALGNELGNRMADGDKKGIARILAAVAGSTVPTLGAAQKEALRSEMQRMQRHGHGQLASLYDDEMPVHLWIEGNAGMNKLSEDGYQGGYKVNSWGGTVGAEVGVSESVQLGLALSAQYGDLEASAADTAKGDLDGTYLSIYTHLQDEEWGHKLLLIYGKNEATLNRTVSYGSGAYHTKGSTDGSSLGLQYELTYDIPLTEDSSSILKPMLVLSYLRSTMNAYNESGAEGASLIVGKQEWSTASIAVGAKWLRRAGSSLFGIDGWAGLTLSVAQELGDTQGEAEVALQANTENKQRVKSAEIGATSVQLGAGYALPVGEGTQLYLNAHADLRSGATTWGAGVGLSQTF